MIPKTVAMAGMLGAAVGVPYVVTEHTNLTEPKAESSQAAPEANPVSPFQSISTSLDGPGSDVYQRLAPVEGYRGMPLTTLLRWDITKEWVYRNWNRKTTGLAEVGLYGVRVPIVTGTQATDIAGTLSYYFDVNGQLQKIRLHGTTADTRPLLQIATAYYGMQRRAPASAGDQLYQANEGKQVRSELSTKPSRVLWSTQPHSSFKIDMELNRASSEYWVVKRDLPTQLASNQTKAPIDSVVESNAKESEPQSVFPPRSVVPDQQNDVQQSQNAPNATPSSASAEEPTSDVKSAEIPSNDIEPLDSYRDRFRWPN